MPTLIQEYFTESAQCFPHKTAVACNDESATYASLDAASNAHARCLARQGLRRGSFAPIFMKKGVASITSILSVLKADCAYVPLDAKSPPQRLREILASTRAAIVVVDTDGERQLRTALGESLPVRLYNIEDTPDAATTPLVYENISRDVAYALFTSGSTGAPKGVMISHQMITDYIDWCVDTFQITDRDVVANHAPLYFDNSTFDLYTAFKAGARLELVHDELNAILSKLVRWLQEREISVMYCVPSVLTILCRSGRLAPNSLPRMRHLIAAGEVLPPDTLRKWMELYPQVQFTNMYGPTEITVTCTLHVQTTMPTPELTAIPIGKARRNMEVFIRLQDGSLTKAAGSTGEIVVRGVSVAYGYLRDTERTRASFLQNPQHDLYHDPIYCTGDIGRIDENGNLMFIGRRDHQIKHMGHRIELGEIEAALYRIEAVSEAVVVYNDSPSAEDKCIGALLCLHEPVTKADLLTRLQRELPGYMVPRRVVIGDQLPRTPNGKVNRVAAFDEVFGSGLGS